jgi:GT2 family glycosyltransferase
VSSLSPVESTTEPMAGSPKVSVVIATWNRRQQLLETLQHVCSEAQPTREVLVVDNASSDGTPDAVAAAFPEVRVLRLPLNRGHTGGANAGAAIARGEYLVMIDDDSFPKEGAISAACQLLDENSAFGAVAGNIYTPSEGQWDMTRFFKPLPTIPNEVPWFVGCGVVIRRDLFANLGGYDERLLFYWEEEDFSFRLGKAGCKIAFHPEAKFVHLRSPANRSSARFTFLLTRNGMWFFRGAYTGWQAAEFCFMLALLNGAVAIASLRISVFLAFLDGLRRGLLEPPLAKHRSGPENDNEPVLFTSYMERFFGFGALPRKIAARFRSWVSPLRRG